MHTIRDIVRLATMLAGLIAPRIRLGFTSLTSRLRLDYALASISCEHCRSSRNHPHCVPRHIIYYFSKKPSRIFFLPTPLIPIILCSTIQYFYNINHNTLLQSVVHNKFTFQKFLSEVKNCHGCDISRVPRL